MATEVITRLKLVTQSKALAAASGYSAEDVISEHASTGTTWTFDGMAYATGRGGRIIQAVIQNKTTAVTPRIVLFLFNNSASLTCAINDHAANTAPVFADRAYFVGAIEFPALRDYGTGMTFTVAAPSTYGNIPLYYTCATTDDALYGVAVTLDAYTQTAADTMRIDLLTEQL